jgi:hypothetical protein
MKRLAIGAAALALLLAGCGNDSAPSPGSVATSIGNAVGGLDTTQCTDAATAMGQAAAAVPLAISGQSVDVQGSVDKLQAAVDAAPDDIQPDLQTVADGYSAFAQVLTDANLQPGQIPSAAVIQQLTDAAQALDTDAFKAAADRVNTWLRDQCGQ